MKTRVLVFPCGSEIGLEINRALSDSIHVEMVGASSVVSNHGKYVYKNYIDGLPFIDDEKFIDEINHIIDKYNIDFIFPAHDSVVLKLSKIKNLLNCEVMGSPVETCQICRSKRKTYQVLKSKVDVPYVYKGLDTDIQFPLFLKPDVGQGAKGTYKVSTMEELEFYIKKDETLIIMEYLPGKEYTVDCFTDRNGQLLFCGPRERKRINDGISTETYPVNDERFSQIAHKINNTLKFRGAWFFQVKERKNGELVLMEASPRIAGSMGLYRNMGINFPLLSIFDKLNVDVNVFYNKFDLKMDRALISRFESNLNYEHVYFDLDDTIVIDNRVNPLAMAFIYQCINNGIKVHLLTRHIGDVESFLKQYHLNNLFETISIVDKNEEKSDYIEESLSIFIDDSYSERFKVFNRLRIPTFDITSIESLLDWRK